MRRQGWILIAGLVVATSACAHSGRGTTQASRPAPQQASVTVHVVNNYILPVDVYASSGGVSYHMGVVEPGMSSTFPVREAMLGDGPIQLTAQARNSSPPVNSSDLLLVAGDNVDFDITPQLKNSMATVRQ